MAQVKGTVQKQSASYNDFKRAPKSPKSPINEFVSSMSRAKGFARTSKYAVVITPPTLLKVLDGRG